MRKFKMGQKVKLLTDVEQVGPMDTVTAHQGIEGHIHGYACGNYIFKYGHNRWVEVEEDQLEATEPTKTRYVRVRLIIEQIIPIEATVSDSQAGQAADDMVYRQAREFYPSPADIECEAVNCSEDIDDV
jgi:hypothetical protein